MIHSFTDPCIFRFKAMQGVTMSVTKPTIDKAHTISQVAILFTSPVLGGWGIGDPVG